MDGIDWSDFPSGPDEGLGSARPGLGVDSVGLRCFRTGRGRDRASIAGWDISRETLAKVESQVRCVTDRELVRFAEALDVDPSELLKAARF